MPPNPLAQRMALPCAACHFTTCKFRNLKKINYRPTALPNPGYTPLIDSIKCYNFKVLLITALKKLLYYLLNDNSAIYMGGVVTKGTFRRDCH